MSSNYGNVIHDPSNYSFGNTVVLFCLAFGSGIIILSVAIFFKRIFNDHYAIVGIPGGTDVLLLNRRGLAPPTLAAIPTFAYQRSVHHGDEAGGWAQCAICLVLVQEGEVVRQLPDCKHLFHVECIDMWLYSHPTCPLCRSDLSQAAPGKKIEPGETSA